MLKAFTVGRRSGRRVPLTFRRDSRLGPARSVRRVEAVATKILRSLFRASYAIKVSALLERCQPVSLTLNSRLYFAHYCVLFVDLGFNDRLYFRAAGFRLVERKLGEL